MDWHRLLGLTLIDFFANSPWQVEVERDLSWKQQRLDILVLRRGPGAFAGQLPDGLDELATYNLLTFNLSCAGLRKSHRFFAVSPPRFCEIPVVFGSGKPPKAM